MQVGSLVKCINGNPENVAKEFPEIIPNKGVIYTVRAIFQTKEGNFLHFEEIVNMPRQYGDAYGECMFERGGFREVQPPMDLSALFKEQLKVMRHQ